MKKRAERPNRYFSYLRRLRAGGRSNMYGAVPYLAAAFGLDRNESFRIICEWIDAQEEAGGLPAVRPRNQGKDASQGEDAARDGSSRGGGSARGGNTAERRAAGRNGGAAAVREPTLFDAPPPVEVRPAPARSSAPARHPKAKRASGKGLKPVKSAAPRGPRAA